MRLNRVVIERPGHERCAIRVFRADDRGSVQSSVSVESVIHGAYIRPLQLDLRSSRRTTCSNRKYDGRTWIYTPKQLTALCARRVVALALRVKPGLRLGKRRARATTLRAQIA